MPLVPELTAYVKRQRRAGQRPDMVFLCNPNNPTGLAVERAELFPCAELLYYQRGIRNGTRTGSAGAGGGL